MTPRILLVEDDPLTQDLIAGILRAKGFDVETASDGLSAVERACGGGYDVALIDYHLPEFDGYSSARLLNRLMPAAGRPKLIAMTADPNSLNARAVAGGVFEAILAKPLEPIALCELVDRMAQASVRGGAFRKALELWRARGLETLPRAVAIPAATTAQAKAIERCFELVEDAGDADVALLVDAVRFDEAPSCFDEGFGHLLPFVDLTGARAAELDAWFRPDDLDSWSSVADAIRAFRARADELAPWLRETRDPATRLLVRLFVAQRDLAPAPAANDPRFFTYCGASGSDALGELAEGLAARGLLSRTFAERFHRCGGCGSHRQNVREECPSCRSSDLSHVPSGNHFRRAGARCRCNDCGSLASKPAVGFVCVDCGGHADGDRIGVRNVYTYALTSRAIAMMFPTTPYAVAHDPAVMTPAL